MLLLVQVDQVGATYVLDLPRYFVRLLRFLLRRHGFVPVDQGEGPTAHHI
jgi:hypothetical protein